MKYNKCLLVLSALAAVVFTGCKNEDVEKHRFDNKFYITSAILSDDLLIKSDTPGYTKTIESRLAKPAGQQVAVTIEADPSQVAAYNMIYGDNAVALPAECYELSSNQIDIAAGQVSGDAIEIVFKDINTLDGSRRYVLPVTVTSCNGVDLLDSRSTVYFVARQAGCDDQRGGQHRVDELPGQLVGRRQTARQRHEAGHHRGPAAQRRLDRRPR